MEKSKVFFTNMHTTLQENLPQKLRRLILSAGIEQIEFERKYTAIKLHFGEPGNLAFLRPNYARVVADVVRERNGKPFLTDCNTLYVGGRKNALDHIESAYINGFSPFSTGCHILIGDGLKGTDEVYVPVADGQYVTEAKIGRAIMDADVLVSLSHFKGHESTGFGGAIKNLGMGSGSHAGKLEMHSDGRLKVDPEKCRGCRACVKDCGQGAIGLDAAIYVVMGQNIGTCVTAIISAIGANSNAKRVAAVHLIFNLIGTLVFLALFYLFNALFRFAFVNHAASAFGIAIIHTVFNVFTVTLLFPFMDKLEWLARRTVHEDKRGERFVVLDDRLLATPSIAVEQCRKLSCEMATIAGDAFLDAMQLLDRFDHKKAEAIADAESQIDMYEDKLGEYMVKVGTRQLSDRDGRELSKLLHIIGDFERISDHAVNLVEVADEINRKKIQFSPAAQHETRVMREAVSECLRITVDAFVKNDLAMAEQVEPLEQVVDLLRSQIKAAHIDRLKTGCCTIELGFVLSDFLTNLERVSDHCSNIATSVIETERHGSVDAHEYVKSLSHGEAGERFQQMHLAYLEKYALGPLSLSMNASEPALESGGDAQPALP